MKIWHEVWDYIKMIIIVVAVVLVINNVVLINAKIPSPSMEKTIMTGDRIFGFRLAYGINLDLFGHEISKKVKDPERFDIVIFKYPDDERQLFIKRVIGLPGETVEIKDGKVYIDGSETALDDSFIPEKMKGSFGPYTVPAAPVTKMVLFSKETTLIYIPPLLIPNFYLCTYPYGWYLPALLHS